MLRPLRFLLVTLTMAAPPAAAQTLPAGPIRAFDGSVVVSGQIEATVGDTDEIAYFNYTDYERNVLRMVRFGASGLWQPARWLAFVGELRSENFDSVYPFAGYVRVRPWRSHNLDIQAGRIPPVFGSFSRRAYGTDSLVIGYPLAYQYLTSLRPDAVPVTADDLLRMRARGWRPIYPVGSNALEPGVPLITAFRWDTGVQVHWKPNAVEIAGAITAGTLSSPRFSDDNSGRQISARVAVHPVVGLVIGASGARGAWLSRDLPQAARRTPMQTAAGADVEYSRDHWLVRSEMVWSQWELPFVLAPSTTRNVSALSVWAEGRYRLTPRVFVAGRAGRLGFSKITGTLFGGQPTPWDAPVDRVEATLGYYLQRNLTARVTAQGNWRDAGRVHQRTYFSGQISYWF
jgi:hypothetical protein